MPAYPTKKACWTSGKPWNTKPGFEKNSAGFACPIVVSVLQWGMPHNHSAPIVPRQEITSCATTAITATQYHILKAEFKLLDPTRSRRCLRQASKSIFNLVWLWPLDLQWSSFHALVTGTTCASLHQYQFSSIQYIMLTSSHYVFNLSIHSSIHSFVSYQRDEGMDGPVEYTAPTHLGSQRQ